MNIRARLRQIMNRDDLTLEEKQGMVKYIAEFEEDSDLTPMVVKPSDGVNPIQETLFNLDDEGPTEDLPSDLMNRTQIAEEFHYSDGWPSYLSHSKNVPYYVVDGLQHWSRADIEAYIDSLSDGRKRNGDQPEEEPRILDFRGKASPRKQFTELLDYETAKGAHDRLGIPYQRILEMMENQEIDCREFGDDFQKIVSVSQIEQLHYYGRKVPASFAPFDDGLWASIMDALQRDSLPHTLGAAVSRACTKGEIANRKIGRLRFVYVPELKDWLSTRED